MATSIIAITGCCWMTFSNKFVNTTLICAVVGCFLYNILFSILFSIFFSFSYIVRTFLTSLFTFSHFHYHIRHFVGLYLTPLSGLWLIDWFKFHHATIII